ncbi:SpoIIAA family protein [Jannaschia marina]|uniref:STAS/SEC14 domain-containing protein n=1 Tax=Jannaschia marina TaxID=2741674 RepID=UPI0015C7E051|nr:STAS/SEC14 domain-containing protein [Jannaschia marina]
MPDVSDDGVPKDAVRAIQTTVPDVFAFEIDGEVSAADMEAMAEKMNAAFDAWPRVSLVLIFRSYEGSELGAGFDWASIKSRLRSLSNLDKYVVVGAPEGAERMIEGLGRILPVEAMTFDLSEMAEAWEAVGAKPVRSGGETSPAP